MSELTLPITIEGLGSPITIKADAEGAFGYFDETTGEIGVRAEADELEKHCIIVHEFLHLTASTLKQAGAITRQPDEAFIVNAATQLTVLLAKAGMLAHVSPADVDVMLPELS